MHGINGTIMTPISTPMNDSVEAFKRTHPEVAEAMRVFDISDAAYQASINALYGSRVSWTNSANDGQTARN